mmetsp:Transcript_7846/g.14580  ORF Transcript_7846/g.14580 Transcript_7846/m.14580 type:complete len:103 (-) Transcript_7846:993-1301(-)
MCCDGFDYSRAATCDVSASAKQMWLGDWSERGQNPFHLRGRKRKRRAERKKSFFESGNEGESVFVDDVVDVDVISCMSSEASGWNAQEQKPAIMHFDECSSS